MLSILYVFLAIILIGILIAVHELGHFCAARLSGIAVRAFGIGFGPVLLRRKGKKSGTEYTLRLIPCGGFCAFYGEDDAQGKDKADPRSMLLQPAWKRLLTIAAGPLMNFVLAFVVVFGYYAIAGIPTGMGNYAAYISQVTPGGPADAAGLRADDIITQVDGAFVNDNLALLLADYQAGDPPLRLLVARGETTFEADITPRFDAAQGRNMIDIMMISQPAETVMMHYRLGTVVKYSGQYCLSAATAVLDFLRQLIFTGEGADQVTGVVGAVDITAQQIAQYKLTGFLNILIVLSINLGLFNLLPIPGLDGARILFVLFEIVFRRPINRKVETYIHLAGYVLLFGLFILITFRDIMNLF